MFHLWNISVGLVNGSRPEQANNLFNIGQGRKGEKGFFGEPGRDIIQVKNILNCFLLKQIVHFFLSQKKGQNNALIWCYDLPDFFLSFLLISFLNVFSTGFFPHSVVFFKSLSWLGQPKMQQNAENANRNGIGNSSLDTFMMS